MKPGDNIIIKEFGSGTIIEKEKGFTGRFLVELENTKSAISNFDFESIQEEFGGLYFWPKEIIKKENNNG